MILHLRRCKKVPVENICDVAGRKFRQRRKNSSERRGPDVLRLMVKDAGAIFRIQDGASVANSTNVAL